MSAELLRGPKAKLARARALLEVAEAPFIAFVKSKPYELRTETVLGAHKSVKVVLLRDVPDELATAIADIIHNLRASLDQLACSLAVHNGRTATGVYFPIADSAQKFG